VNAVRNSLVPFILVSSVFHLLLVVSWYARYDRRPVMRDIPIRVIPAPPEPPPVNPQLSREAPARPARPSAQLAKKSPPPAPAVPEPDKTQSKIEKDRFGEQPVNPRPRRIEDEAITSRPLPTLKDLLPPVYMSSAERNQNRENPVRLDSQEPKYVPYLTTVKQAIDIVWVYPEIAKRYGLQGKLLLEFTVAGNGQLEELRLIRSSGSSILDEEAMRAVQAAAPFRPIPRSMGRNHLPIVASFEYYGSGLKYGYTP
jgi:protein TonB